jgi:hypothetical protein
MNTTTTVPELAEAIAAAAPGLDENGRRVAVALYQLLADGDPTTAEAVAERAGVTRQAAEGVPGAGTVSSVSGGRGRRLTSRPGGTSHVSRRPPTCEQRPRDQETATPSRRGKCQRALW